MKTLNVCLVVCIFHVSVSAMARVEPIDSVAESTPYAPSIPSGLETHETHLAPAPSIFNGVLNEPIWQSVENPLPLLHVNPLATALPPMGYVPGQASIYSWGSGGFFASGERSNLYGLMGIESGAIDFRQRIGAFSFSIYASAAKYGYFRGLSTSYGFGGSMSYDFNEHLSMTLFGSYASPAGITQPAMMGYVAAPVIGGYLNWKASEHWGVKVGAQSYRSIASGRWEAQPIVMPYYRTSGGAEIGVDVGGMLYQVIRQASGGSWGNQGNPTIGRPDFGPPPVAPRR